MPVATVSAKGQITIPASVRSSMGLDAGCKVAFVEIVQGRYEIVAEKASVQSLKGLLRKPAKPVSIEIMNAVIAAHGMKKA